MKIYLFEIVWKGYTIHAISTTNRQDGLNDAAAYMARFPKEDVALVEHVYEETSQCQ